VINLRGNVVPVVDVRLKLGLGQAEPTVDTCVIITEVSVGGEFTILGALVDSVQEVMELDGACIAPPPRMAARIDTSVILGMGKLTEEFVLILDIDKVLSTEESPASLPD